MDHSSILLVVSTEVLLIAANVLAFSLIRRCRIEAMAHSWIFVSFRAWLGLGLVLGVAQVIVICVGCPPLPVMRILLWVDRTVLFMGYLSLALALWQVGKLKGPSNE